MSDIDVSYLKPAEILPLFKQYYKSLIFLGIDIMSTMKVKDEAEDQGYKIVAYESYCGGLPVAE